DASVCGLRDRQLGSGRVEDAGQARRPPRLDPEGNDVLDLEVDGVADLDAVPKTLLLDLDRGTLDAQVLADEGPERLHRPAELPAEDRAELFSLLVGSRVVDEDAEPPVAVGHQLRSVDDRRKREA